MKCLLFASCLMVLLAVVYCQCESLVMAHEGCSVSSPEVSGLRSWSIDLVPGRAITIIVAYTCVQRKRVSGAGGERESVGPGEKEKCQVGLCGLWE